jgi:hypothetical protein
MKVRGNLLLVSEEGVLSSDNEPYPDPKELERNSSPHGSTGSPFS